MYLEALSLFFNGPDYTLWDLHSFFVHLQCSGWKLGERGQQEDFPRSREPQDSFSIFKPNLLCDTRRLWCSRLTTISQSDRQSLQLQLPYGLVRRLAKNQRIHCWRTQMCFPTSFERQAYPCFAHAWVQMHRYAQHYWKDHFWFIWSMFGSVECLSVSCPFQSLFQFQIPFNVLFDQFIKKGLCTRTF